MRSFMNWIFGYSNSRQAASPQKIAVVTEAEALRRQLAALQSRYDELNGRYATLYALNQSQANRIDALTGANEMLGK